MPLIPALGRQTGGYVCVFMCMYVCMCEHVCVHVDMDAAYLNNPNVFSFNLDFYNSVLCLHVGIPHGEVIKPLK